MKRDLGETLGVRTLFGISFALSVASVFPKKGELSGEGAAVKKLMRAGKIGWVVLWLLGVPLLIALLLYVVRGCT